MFTAAPMLANETPIIGILLFIKYPHNLVANYDTISKHFAKKHEIPKRQGKQKITCNI